MLELIRPTTDLFTSWQESHAEWGEGFHEDGFGLDVGDDVETREGFAKWVARLDAGEDLCVCRWIVEDGNVLGGIALRLEDSEFALAHGHIGYGVRPRARGQHVASWALGTILAVARDRSMKRVLAVCEAGNVASARTLERAGGVLDRQSDRAEVRRYWIETNVVAEAMGPTNE